MDIQPGSSSRMGPGCVMIKDPIKVVDKRQRENRTLLSQSWLLAVENCTSTAVDCSNGQGPAILPFETLERERIDFYHTSTLVRFV